MLLFCCCAERRY